MVAKSYQSLPQVGTPYEKNGKEYIKVLYNGREKEVRWYLDPTSLSSLHKARFNNQDVIWIAPQITLEEGIAANLKDTGARYRCAIGWYWFSKPLNIYTIAYEWDEELKLIEKEGILKNE